MADAPTGQGWCWISEVYKVERWACHSIFLFIDMLALPIIFYLARQLQKQNQDPNSPTVAETPRPRKEDVRNPSFYIR